MTRSMESIRIRTDLRPGDLGWVVHLHGKLYASEYGYGIGFESYVAAGLHEFWSQYDETRDCVWICEHNDLFVGFLLLMHRPDDAAQLRYFLLHPDYRGMGLGKKLMDLYMDFLRSRSYRSSYLWTTHELSSAAALYMRHGFELKEEKASDAFGKAVKEQRYELVLGRTV